MSDDVWNWVAKLLVGFYCALAALGVSGMVKSFDDAFRKESQ